MMTPFYLLLTYYLIYYSTKNIIILLKIVVIIFFFLLFFFYLYIVVYILDKDGDMFQWALKSTIHAKGLAAFFATNTLILAKCQMKLERMGKW